MDGRMYPLADYIGAIRQDWRLPDIHRALDEVAHLPYQHVAVAAVRAACDAKSEKPRRLVKMAKSEAGGATGQPNPPGAGDRCPTHYGWAGNCPGCRADRLAGADQDLGDTP